MLKIGAGFDTCVHFWGVCCCVGGWLALQVEELKAQAEQTRLELLDSQGQLEAAQVTCLYAVTLRRYAAVLCRPQARAPECFTPTS